MVKDIVSKLDAELRQEITSERQVVYILVEVRKLIDKDELAGDFEALRLHCDWAVHPTLSRSSAKRLLDKLNKRYADARLMSEPGEAMKELDTTLGLRALQTEFHSFLSFYELDESFCNGDWWFDFLYHYSHVIQDCPLKGVAGPDWSFDSVVLIDPDLTCTDAELYLQWEFSLRGQQIGLWLHKQTRTSLDPFHAQS